MRAVVFALSATALLLAVPVPITATSEEPVVRIVEVHPRPVADGREFIELWNPGPDDVELAGWNLTDGTNTFTFDAWALGPGERVVVWGGGNGSVLGPVWKANVWNNGGDAVMLVDPDGATVDHMEYGTTDVPVPDEGQSLHWENGWVQDLPTAGQDRDGSQGIATVTVDDLPPEFTVLDAPTTARPGESVLLRFQVTDPNGDPLAWSVHAGDTEVANGTDSGTFEVNASAPATDGAWTWTLTAASTTHETVVTWDTDVAAGPFRIVLPEEGIHFPDLVPGATGVAASASFGIIHQGTEMNVPHIDISPFDGDGAQIPVDGNLELQVLLPDNTSTVVPYDGPLRPLPALSPGERMDVTIVIQEVPAPLAAGAYRTSFTVVA